MSLWEAVFLGIIQGLTEFLPVSSSGHLVITQYILGVKKPGVTFEVIVHFGTLLSVLWVFYYDIKRIVLAGLWITSDLEARRMFYLLIIGCIPTGLMGLLLHSLFVGFFNSVLIVGFMLLLTGSLLWIINWKVPGKKKAGKMTFWDALFIGLFQGLAIIPGISRSGATISAALFKDLNRETAVRYSFILALPAILGASLMEFRKLILGVNESEFILYLVAGAVLAFLSGVLAIRTFIRFLHLNKLHYFAYYCWLTGSLVILWQVVQRFN
ncbi:MAG: undecaprenyl-diphosphate phosphatase [Candidatus Syntrophonatronum acetioxidans]|uniref:Undecaprenyl-diphosphatase n=1 Tax=Candidatus Syntrophonatronum acetioxidans TaxID=1795816 RepID=A0A424YDT8_9FIRM|nr:MAG: undecaprenyl-diphosphate phosphatase [Candidatus Syntrophonatronum acetioxidans]